MPPSATTRARFHQHHVIGEAQHLVELMADIHHGNRTVVTQALQVRQHFGAPRRIQRGQRLIQQQQPRLRQQRAADGDALALAARKTDGAPRQQRRQAQQLLTTSKLMDCALRRRARCVP